MMWALWLELESGLDERRPFSPIIELLNSGQASKLLSAVPQLPLPINAPTPTYFQASLGEVKAEAVESIEPVDFEHIDAIIESKRLAQRGVTRGKILACRKPDLYIQYNCVISFRGWETIFSQGEVGREASAC